MNYATKNSLPQIVKGIHDALFLYQKTEKQDNIHSCSNAFLPYFKNTYQNLGSVWPLTKGAVARLYEPWNVFSTSEDCIRFSAALAIKAFYTLNIVSSDNPQNLFNKIFWNKIFCVLNWDFVQKYSDQIFFSQKYNLSHKLVILCLQSTQFPMRQNSNEDFVLFENFLDHVARSSGGLVVFSQQNLFARKKLNFHTNYSMSDVRNNIKNYKSISIEEAFLPTVFSKNSISEDENMFSVGAFDRLFELLALGQDFIFTIEKEFKEVQRAD